MMIGSEASATLDRLIAETRARREELHSLMELLRRDHKRWTARAESLPRRERLTAGQRQLFRVHLARYKTRGRP